MQEYNFNGYNQQPESPKKKSNWWKFLLVAVSMLLVGAIATYAVMSGGMIQRYVQGLTEAPTQEPTQEAQTPPETPAPTPEVAQADPTQAQTPPASPVAPREGYTPPEVMPTFGAPAPGYVNPISPVPDICQNVTPSVVGIIATVPIDESRGSSGNFFGDSPDGGTVPWFDEFFNEKPGESASPAPESTPAPATGETQVSGSGVVLTQDGYIITNYHVVKNATKVEIALFNSGERFEAQVIGGSPTDDIAILKADRNDLTPVALGDSTAARLGELVVAIGNPMSASVGTVTQGIISAVEQEVTVDGISAKYIQTDAAVNPGNSGGALVNSRGELIGIVTLKTVIAGYDEYGNEIPADGIGFAIPVNRAIKVAQQIIETGEAFRPAIGISARALGEDEAKERGCPMGILAAEIYENSPAQAAGIQVDDVLITVEGADLTAIADPAERLQFLLETIANKPRGYEMPLKVWRAGEEIDLTLVIGNMNDFQKPATQQG